MQVFDPNSNKNKNYKEQEKTFFPRSELNDWTPRWEKLVFFLSGFLGLNLIARIVVLILMPFAIGSISSALLNFICYLILFIAFMLVIILDKRKTYKRVLNGFTSWKYFLYGIIGFLAVFIFQELMSMLISLAPVNGTNSNQQSIDNNAVSSPILTFITVVIMGPIVEEFTYRAGLLDLIGHKKRWLGIALSAIIFGFIHFDFSSLLSLITLNQADFEFLEDFLKVKSMLVDAVLLELLHLPIYIGSGFILGFVYAKSGKLSSSIITHMLLNLLSFVAIIIVSKMTSSDVAENLSASIVSLLL